jgi:hypothetical protein
MKARIMISPISAEPIIRARTCAASNGTAVCGFLEQQTGSRRTPVMLEASGRPPLWTICARCAARLPVESLKDRARAVADRFSALTDLDLPESRFLELYGKARSELNGQIAALRGMGVSDAWPSVEEQAAEAADPAPAWCQDETR